MIAHRAGAALAFAATLSIARAAGAACEGEATPFERGLCHNNRSEYASAVVAFREAADHCRNDDSCRHRAACGMGISLAHARRFEEAAPLVSSSCQHTTEKPFTHARNYPNYYSTNLNLAPNAVKVQVGVEQAGLLSVGVRNPRENKTTIFLDGAEDQGLVVVWVNPGEELVAIWRCPNGNETTSRVVSPPAGEASLTPPPGSCPAVEPVKKLTGGAFARALAAPLGEPGFAGALGVTYENGFAEFGAGATFAPRHAGIWPEAALRFPRASTLRGGVVLAVPILFPTSDDPPTFPAVSVGAHVAASGRLNLGDNLAIDVEAGAQWYPFLDRSAFQTLYPIVGLRTRYLFL